MTDLRQNLSSPSRRLSLSTHRSHVPPRRIIPSSGDLLGRTFDSFAPRGRACARNLGLINSKSDDQITWKLAVYVKLSDRCRQSASVIARRQFRMGLHNLAAPPSRKSRGCLSSLLVGWRFSLSFFIIVLSPRHPHPSFFLTLLDDSILIR